MSTDEGPAGVASQPMRVNEERPGVGDKRNGKQPIDDLIDDLADLSRITAPADIRDFRGRLLGALSDSAGMAPQELLEVATERIADERYRTAAAVLLIDSAIRTANLTERSARAAEAFGLNLDGFRRRRRSRPSARDEVYGEVAHQIIEECLTPNVDGEPPLEVVGPPAPEQRRSASSGSEVGSGGDGPANEDGQRVAAVGGLGGDGLDEAALGLGSSGVALSPPWRGAALRTALIVVGLTLVSSIVIVAGLPNLLTSPPAETDPDGTHGLASPIAPSSEIKLVAGEIDVTLHCVDQHGSGWSARPSGRDDLGWNCRSLTGTERPADLDIACAEQYGPAAAAVNRASSAGDWRCELVIPAVLLDGGCAIEPGGFDSAAAFEFATFAVPFRERFLAAGGVEVLGCPQSTMHRWGSGVLQEFGSGERATGALVSAGPDAAAVLLVGSSWDAFNRIKGITGSFVGYPTAEPVFAERAWSVPLTGGGALVARREEGEYIWIPPVVYDLWIDYDAAAGCLGFPITDPYTSETGFRQDFEHGRLGLDPLAGTLGLEAGEC